MPRQLQVTSRRWHSFEGFILTQHCAVLRMLSHFVGEEIFLKGVSIYLKKHLYSNSVTKDLWEGIQEASGKVLSTNVP